MDGWNGMEWEVREKWVAGVGTFSIHFSSILC